jgi:hypothetical protein
MTKDKNPLIKSEAITPNVRGEIRKEAPKTKRQEPNKYKSSKKKIRNHEGCRLWAMSYEQTALYPMPYTLHLIVTKDQ